MPSDKAIRHLEEHSHAFEEVDDYHILGASVTFVAYAERKGEMFLSARGHPKLGSVDTIVALSGGEAGESRWDFAKRIGYYKCEWLD